MKCPKCGFNSFEGLKNCKKCDAELNPLRERSEKEQGELFAAVPDEGLVPESFCAEINEEFGDGSVGAEDCHAEAEEGRETIEIADLPDSREEEVLIEPELRKSRALAAGVDLFVIAAMVGLFVLCALLVLFQGSGAPTKEALLLPFLVVSAAMSFLYFTLFHYLTGQTPGKMVFDLIVDSREGGALLFSQAFLRSFGGGLCLLSLGIGFAPILWRPDGRGWNDSIAGSRVIRLADESDI